MFREGEFTNLPKQKNFTIFISSHDDDGTVGGIMINDERDPVKHSTTTAEKGIIVQTPAGPRIILINGSRQEINRKNGRFSSVSFERYSVDFGLKGTRARSKDSVRVNSFSDLINAQNNPSLSLAEQRKGFVEGNKRITTPLLSVVFSLIGCTGLLISNFSRRGQGKTLGISLSAVIIIQAIDLVSGNLASHNLCWLLLMYTNIILPIIVCIFILFNPQALKVKHKDKGEAYA